MYEYACCFGAHDLCAIASLVISIPAELSSIYVCGCVYACAYTHQTHKPVANADVYVCMYVCVCVCVFVFVCERARACECVVDGVFV